MQLMHSFGQIFNFKFLGPNAAEYGGQKYQKLTNNFPKFLKIVFGGVPQP